MLVVVGDAGGKRQRAGVVLAHYCEIHVLRIWLFAENVLEVEDDVARTLATEGRRTQVLTRWVSICGRSCACWLGFLLFVWSAGYPEGCLVIRKFCSHCGL